MGGAVSPLFIYWNGLNSNPLQLTGVTVPMCLFQLHNYVTYTQLSVKSEFLCEIRINIIEKQQDNIQHKQMCLK